VKKPVIMILLAVASLTVISSVRCSKNGIDEIEKKCEDDCRRIHRECRKDPAANTRKKDGKLSLCDSQYFRCIRNCSDYPSLKDQL